MLSDNVVVLDGLCDFDVAQTLECGQCFRFERLEDGHFKVVAFGKVLFVRQRVGKVEFYPTAEHEFETVWKPYFDLARNYESIARTLSQNDAVMREACEFSRGLRVLNQDPWETLISFIISQHNAIPNIKRVVNNLCQRFGKPIIGTTEHSFPNPQALLEAGLERLEACKTGFRAKYILDACQKVLNGEVEISADAKCVPLRKSSQITTPALRENLMKIKGVGEKVADCTLLYGFARTDCFPVDVWIKRAIERRYFNGKETPIKEITAFAQNKFGPLSGYANIYLFNYIRNNPN